MKKPKANTITFLLSELKTLNYNLAEDKLDGLDKNVIPQVTYNIKAVPSINPVTKLFHIELLLEMFLDPELSNKIGEIKTYMSFVIQNFGEIFIIDKKGNYKFPNQVIVTFLGIILSTTRGILFEKTRGTIIQHSYFPVVNIQDIKFDLRVVK